MSRSSSLCQTTDSLGLGSEELERYGAREGNWEVEIRFCQRHGGLKSGRETLSERQMEEWIEIDSAGEGDGSRDQEIQV